MSNDNYLSRTTTPRADRFTHFPIPVRSDTLKTTITRDDTVWLFYRNAGKYTNYGANAVAFFRDKDRIPNPSGPTTRRSACITACTTSSGCLHRLQVSGVLQCSPGLAQNAAEYAAWARAKGFLPVAAAGAAAATAPNAASAATPAPAVSAEVLAAGQRVWNANCIACHTLEQDGPSGVGPNLWNVVGVQAAGKPEFAYTAAMQQAGLVWNEATLDKFLRAPMSFLPGTVMAAVGVTNDADRAAVIAFLRARGSVAPAADAVTLLAARWRKPREYLSDCRNPGSSSIHARLKEIFGVVGVLWRRLNALMDETAQTFVRTSFSSVVRDNWDLAVSLMDSHGRMFAQSSRSVPSFIGTMPRTLAEMLKRYPAESLRPGDVLISNDGYIGTGHLNDITMVRPIHRKGRLIAFVGSVFHSVDIGGAPSIDARDSYAEGLTIPVSLIVRAGVENADVIAFLEENLRSPEETLGDIRAQFAAYGLCIGRLLKMLDGEGIDDLDGFVGEILDRSEASMKRAIAAIPDGSYGDSLLVDGFEEPLRIQCEVRVKGEALTVDFAGTSPQIDKPINSVLNFTTAYSAYAIKCALDPAVPNNDGCFRPVTITAPEGSLLNPRRPAPIWARHLSGHYLPAVIFSALAPQLPNRVIADCGSPIWNVYFAGKLRNGRRFVKMYFMNGGHGARPDGEDGPACLSFPSNIATVPIEQFENSVPLLITEKALMPDSGGAGRYRGGLAQRVSFRVTSIPRSR